MRKENRFVVPSIQAPRTNNLRKQSQRQESYGCSWALTQASSSISDREAVLRFSLTLGRQLLISGLSKLTHTQAQHGLTKAESCAKIFMANKKRISRTSIRLGRHADRKSVV